MRKRYGHAPRLTPGAGLSTSQAIILIAWLERMAEAVWLHHRDAIQASNDLRPAVAPVHTTKAQHDTNSDANGPLWTDDDIPF